MAVGDETIRTIPAQHIFVARRTHDRFGWRLINLLGADASYDSGVMQIRGNTDLEVFNLSDQEGIVYIYVGVSPITLNDEIVWSAYDLTGYGASYIQRCAAEYARVIYENGDVAQGVWEFSIQFRPIGR